MLRLFGWVCGWGGVQTDPPERVPGSSAIPAEADSAKKKKKVMIIDLTVPPWSRCVTPPLKEATVFIWRREFWVTHGATCQQPE